MSPKHNFDIATELTKHSPGVYSGQTSEAYANMVGPFGGVIASTLLRAVLDHDERIGNPISLTINYAAPVANGNFNLFASPTRTNRSTQHWYIELTQNKEVVISGTAVTAKRRDTWSSTESLYPDVPSPEQIKPTPLDSAPPWAQNYEIRMIKGAPLALTPNDNPDSITLQWIRDYPDRNLDFLSLAAICDAFFPRIYVRRQEFVPIGTISLTIYFHANEQNLATNGNHSVLGHTRALKFFNGYFDQTGEIWSHDGTLLATTSQLVYYKE
ncbi:acyl-CoA thioesterase [Staphylococcus edaphicus]|uniref:Acyl-CoA thioesterase n=1 Tax=Staphylococcus edaphicus TaxID=1955013 RepID=A0A2C6WR52_9STAP|nr:thioesterase family protein [Staphylococcus edaphicus]PHK49937.1 acyl-CoA thioesterase [Staphylococcus edaphicus]UQW81802.1 thioesterase family protein [Staphylococcus edaphicus]